MKYLLPIDTDEAYDWAYENGLSKVNAKQAEWLGFHSLPIPCPAEVEVEFDLIPGSSTRHISGVEKHKAEVTGVMVNNEPVKDVPKWLEDKLMEIV